MNHRREVTLLLSGSPLSLPPEHGAVCVFATSCAVSLLICASNPVPMLVAVAALWAIMLSLHNPQQSVLPVVLAAVVFQRLSGPLPALWMLALGIAGLYLRTGLERVALPRRELLGMGGAALVPLCFSFLFCGDAVLHLTVAGSLLASVLTGIALVRVQLKNLSRTALPSAVISFLLWLLLALNNSVLTALLILPYSMTAVWLSRTENTSFAVMGRVQAGCLVFVVLVLAMHLYGAI